MTTIVQAHAAEDLLALVPQLTGFTPRDSLVVVLFAGRRSRGALRIGLPQGTDLPQEVVEVVAQRALGLACRAHGVDAVVPVLYTDEPFGVRVDADGRVEPPGGAIAQACIALAERQGFVVKDALCSAADGWASYLDPVVPVGGRSLDLVASSPVNGVAPVPDELVTAELAPATPAELAAVGDALQVLTGRLEALVQAAGDPAPAVPPEWLSAVDRLDELPEFFEEVLHRGVDALSAEEVALLLIACSRAWASDVALMQWAFGRALGEEVFEAECEQAHVPLDAGDAEVFHRVARLLVGDGPRPDVDRVQTAVVLLRTVAGRAPEPWRPPLLGMLAWFSWALGQSSRAAAFLEQLPAEHHDDGLAPTIRALIGHGELPAWAFTDGTDCSAGSSEAPRGATHPAA